MSMLMDPAGSVTTGPPKCLGDECLKAVLNTPAGESNEIAQGLAQGLGVVAIGVPLAYLAATKFVEWVNERYEELSREGGDNGVSAPANDAPSPYPWRK